MLIHCGVESGSQREIGILEEEGVNGAGEVSTLNRREKNNFHRHFKLEVECEAEGGILNYSQLIGLGDYTMYTFTNVVMKQNRLKGKTRSSEICRVVSHPLFPSFFICDIPRSHIHSSRDVVTSM